MHIFIFYLKYFLSILLRFTFLQSKKKSPYESYFHWSVTGIPKWQTNISNKMCQYPTEMPILAKIRHYIGNIPDGKSIF